jgi:hypothetical protein
MPVSMRGVLYRTVHHVTDPGYAQRQAVVSFKTKNKALAPEEKDQRVARWSAA